MASTDPHADADATFGPCGAPDCPTGSTINVTALAERGDNWWVITVPEVEGTFTQVEDLGFVQAMVADAVGLMLEVDPARVQVIETVVVDTEE